jgi:hypothetical protein
MSKNIPKTERELNEIRGKLQTGSANCEDIEKFLAYTEVVEELVEEASGEDFYGTEGWKHRIGWD